MIAIIFLYMIFIQNNCQEINNLTFFDFCRKNNSFNLDECIYFSCLYKYYLNKDYQTKKCEQNNISIKYKNQINNTINNLKYEYENNYNYNQHNNNYYNSYDYNQNYDYNKIEDESSGKDNNDDDSKYDILYFIIGGVISLCISGGCCTMCYKKCKNSNTN